MLGVRAVLLAHLHNVCRGLGLTVRGPRIHQLAALLQRLTSTVGSASGSIDRSLLNHLKESLFD
jgi:hypothetical protein